MLGNEAAAVLSNERGELVKHPAVDDLWRDEAEENQMNKNSEGSQSVQDFNCNTTGETLTKADAGVEIRLGRCY